MSLSISNMNNTFIITLVRHGETLANRDRILQGQTDTNLSDLGKQQAKLVGLRLRDIRFTHMFSSDLARAAETATAIAAANAASSCQLVLDSRLRERSFGVLEGKTLHDLKATISKSGMSFETFSSNGAESMDSVISRAKSFLADLFKIMSTSHTDMATLAPISNTEDFLTVSNNDLSYFQSSSTIVVPNASMISHASVHSTDSLTSLISAPHLADIPSLTSLTSLLGLGGKDSIQSSDTDLANTSHQTPHLSITESVRLDTDDVGTDLDVPNILVVSHGLLLREMTRLILGCYLGKLDGQLIKETMHVCHNTGVSRYLMQVTSMNEKTEIHCLRCLIVNDVSHLTSIYQGMVTQFNGAA
ncbi:fructose-2,6-bisphosphatase TIGAR B-like isoform X2 [Biomphalaria glabrata]|uniref:Fructose-2,6-bisphosphatase TIGAR n=1 Tax=Biomphalaria glabrata TaxID=6526 RepID=A0A9U8ELR0_BIOGL|nr:fructose-2,6-bisphosphatase TIGAR B-like isoform X2 [Biomphalaria glabrata]